MKSHFQHLFAYDAWANQRIIHAMQQLQTPDERCLQLLSHIFAAQKIWLGRITNKMSFMAPFPNSTLQECIDAFASTSRGWNDFLNSVSENDLSKIVHYKNTKGEQFSNTIIDILTHVINHSTYHRAQIVAALKGKIEKLPITDFIAFARE